MKEKIKSLAEQYFDEIVGIRQHIHQHPELSFQEKQTSKYIISLLKKWNIDYEAGIIETGIVATVKGRNPLKNIVALKADIDALPIVELNEVGYKSKNEGVMHACGHDVHTAALLGTIKILDELKEEWEGTVKFIFQPGEEKFPGGASLMIKDGLLKKHPSKLIFAQHVYPELEAGKVGFREGKYMASADEIFISIKGKGGHGAMPHQNIDPVLIASHVIVNLQQVVSRNAHPAMPSVLSFGKIIADGATNVIPDEVKIEGTFRTMNEEWRAEAHKHIEKIATSTAEGMGAKAEVTIKKGYPSLINDAAVTKKAREAAEEYLGNENVVDLPLRMTADDFAYFSQEMPSCYYRLGVRNEAKGITAPVHNAKFDIDESSLKIATGLMSWILLGSIEI